MPLADGLALEAQAGRRTFAKARRGAARFAAGEGRGGSGRWGVVELAAACRGEPRMAQTAPARVR